MDDTTLVAPRGPVSAALAFAAVALCMLAALFALTIENSWLALAVPLAVGFVYALYRLPLRLSVLGVLFMVLSLEGLQYALGSQEIWRVPVLNPLAEWLFYNLNTLTGIGPLRAPLVDLVTVALFVVALVRSKQDGWTSQGPGVRAMHSALWASAACAVVLVLLGAVQGGSVDESLWQVRHVLLLPVRAVLVIWALDGSDLELRTVGKLIIAAAVVKASLGLWLFYVVAPAAGVVPEYTTSHTDTLLFVPVLAMYVAMVLEARSPKTLLAGLPWAALVLWGMVCNDRRISYVSLCIGAIVLLLVSNATPVKRVLARGLTVLSPLLPVYLVAGWTTDGQGFFAPVGVLKTLVVGEHRFGVAVDYRDLENLDLMHTWSQHKLVPLGFGQKFTQLFPLPDLSSWFPAWEYHPHNSYLWFFVTGGPLGFTLMMLPFIATLYLAARTYRAASSFEARVAMLTAIAVVIAFLNQMWGDMGTLSWTPSWMAALAAGLSAKLAMRTDAWPAVLRIRSR